MQQIPYQPKKHILVCTNEREPGKDCCAHTGSYEIFSELKEFVKVNGLASQIWITRTGCMGFCNNIGATVAIYPDKIWLTQVKKEEVQKIKDFITDSVKI